MQFTWQPWPSTLPPHHPQCVIQPCSASVSPSVRWRWMVFLIWLKYSEVSMRCPALSVLFECQPPISARYTNHKDHPGSHPSPQHFRTPQVLGRAELGGLGQSQPNVVPQCHRPQRGSRSLSLQGQNARLRLKPGSATALLTPSP